MALYEEKSDKVVQPFFRLIYDNYCSLCVYRDDITSDKYIRDTDVSNWSIVEANNKFGLIDKTGKAILPIEYDNIDPNIYYSYFFDPVDAHLLFLIIVQKNGKYGLVSIKRANIYQECKVLFEPIFDSINKIKYSPMFEVTQDNMLGRINNFGRYIFQPKYDLIEGISLPNNFKTNFFYKIRINNKYGFADYRGDIMLQPIYDEIHDFVLINDKKMDTYGRIDNDNCMAKVKLNGKCGYIDLNMNIAIKPVFDDIHAFKNFKTYNKKSVFLAVVKLHDKYGLIDLNGNFVVKPNFDNMKSMALYESWTKLMFKQDDINKVAFISKNGECKMVCDGIAKYGTQLFIVKRGDKYGLINRDGDVILNVKYDSIEKYEENKDFIKVTLNNKYGCALLNGELILDVIYDEITYIFCNKLFARVRIGNEYKLVDTDKNFAIDIIGIQAPNELQQLEAVNYDAHLIKYIKNPTEKVQLQAIKKDADFIRFIDNPTEAVQLEAVNKKPDIIKYIKNPTERVQLEVVCYGGSLIEFIHKPCESVLKHVNVRAYLHREQINLNSNLKYEIPEYEKDEIRYL